MRLFNLKETAIKTGVGRATIYRFYENHKELFSETKLVNRKRLIPEAHLKLISKNNIYTKHLALEQEYTQIKNLVDAITTNDFLYKLYLMGWDWFGTIAFKNTYSQTQCFHRMQQAVAHIEDLYGDRTGIQVFYTVEPFTNREGSHVHFVLRLSNPKLWPDVNKELQNYFKGSRIEMTKYNKYKAGVYYMAKHGLRGENWDILGKIFTDKNSQTIMSKS